MNTPNDDAGVPSSSSTSGTAVLLGVGASLGMGIALFIASRFIYVYILYNQMIGSAIGSAIGHGYKSARNGKARRASLPLVLGCSFLAYLCFYFCFAIFVYVVELKKMPTFFELLVGPFAVFWGLANGQAVFGWHPGVIGS